MNFLLDTNVVSEWVKPRPDPGVVEWLATADEDRLFLSVVTLAELRYGVERLAAGRKRARLQQWLEMELTDRFRDRIVDVSQAVAGSWGKLLAKAETIGQTVGVIDGFLAATALVHEMTLVTRNVEDFSDVGIKVFNPWGR